MATDASSRGTAALWDVLFDEPSVGRCLVGPDGTILRANAEWLRFAGVASSRAVGVGLADATAGAPAAARLARARAGARVEVVRRSRRLAGRDTWWDESIAPVPADGGTGLLISVRESPQPGSHADPGDRYRRLFLALREPVLVADVVRDGAGAITDWVVRDVNAEAVAQMAMTRDQIVGRSIVEVAGPRFAAMLVATSRVVMITGNARRVEAYFEATNRWYLSTVFRLDERTVVAASSDVTELKRSEAALRESERRFRAAVDHLPASLVIYDAGRRVQFVNAAGHAAGPSAEPLPGKREEDVLPAELVAGLLPYRDRAFETGTVQTFEWTEPERFGRRTLLVTYVPVKDDDGAIQQVLAIAVDVTERRRAERALREANERLREADRRKDEFLGMLSHELRNPLAPIRTSVYVLQRADASAEQGARALGVIARQTEHLTRLVDDLLDVTRVARGKIVLHRERVDVGEIVARAVDDARLAIERRRIALRVDVPPARLWADADATRVTQIVGNLLNNAAKFTNPGGEIAASLREADGAAEISVRDDGAGIDPELLPKLFDPFVQGERTLARSEGGLGLGLALVKALADLHGGTVRARSDGIGRGAEFVVTLPLAPAPVEAPPPPAPAIEPSRGSRRVLVVDDNADAAESLAEIIALCGHHVEVAYDGPSALEKARQARPDVVLCDLGLPGMNGYEVARALRAAHGAELRLVAVSGYAQPEDVQRSIEAGFDDHVAKPPDPAYLERLIASRAQDAEPQGGEVRDHLAGRS